MVGIPSHIKYLLLGSRSSNELQNTFSCCPGGPAFAIQANPSVAKLAIVRRPPKASMDLEEQGHDRNNLVEVGDASPGDAEAGDSGEDQSPGSRSER